MVTVIGRDKEMGKDEKRIKATAEGGAFDYTAELLKSVDVIEGFKVAQLSQNEQLNLTRARMEVAVEAFMGRPDGAQFGKLLFAMCLFQQTRQATRGIGMPECRGKEVVES